jgi:hypothetical protein
MTGTINGLLHLTGLLGLLLGFSAGLLLGSCAGSVGCPVIESLFSVAGHRALF